LILKTLLDTSGISCKKRGEMICSGIIWVLYLELQTAECVRQTMDRSGNHASDPRQYIAVKERRWMQVRHNSRPENGPQHTAISNGSQRCLTGTRGQKEITEINPQERFAVSDFQQNTPQKGSQSSDLVGGLRWWAGHHNWDELNRYSNEIRFNRAFAKGVRTAVDELMAAGLVLLAMQIKNEFLRLQKAVGELDDSCFWRIDTEDKCLRFQEKKGQLAESLCDLAAMLESGTQNRECRIKNEETVPDGEWMTVTEAGKLLGKNRGTISHWAKTGKITDNGKKGHLRRILKTDILLIKQTTEEADARRDLQDLQDDSRRIK